MTVALVVHILLVKDNNGTAAVHPGCSLLRHLVSHVAGDGSATGLVEA